MDNLAGAKQNQKNTHQNTQHKQTEQGKWPADQLCDLGNEKA
jgi:hypothetical protein